MARVHTEVQTGCSIDEMKDGDVAVIVTWPHAGYVGLVVQRYGTALVALGRRSGRCWPTLFDSKCGNDFQVRILPKGTLIEI